MGAENLIPTGIRSPDRPARSESLYRLRYPGTWAVSIEEYLQPSYSENFMAVPRIVYRR